MSKVLVLNGSPRVNGNTKIALNEVVKSLNEEGIETEIVEVGGLDIRGCQACRKCFEIGKCAIDDIVNELARKLYAADGFLVGSPTYCGSPNGTLISLLDRLFFSTFLLNKSMKVAAAVVVATRIGNTSSFDVINKYFTTSNMVVVGSQCWNNAYGFREGEAAKDEQGMQTMRHLGKNMAFVIKAIKDAKEKYKINFKEKPIMTRFIR